MRTVLCFGEALVDIFNTGHHREGPLQLPEYRQYPGGAPANTAVAVAKLGGTAKFIGQVGEDAFGRFLLDALQRYNVGTELITMTEEAQTAVAFVFLDDSGERSFSFYRHKTADMLIRPDQIDGSWFDESTILHFCSNTLTEATLAQTTEYVVLVAKNAGTLISFDVNLRHNLWSQNSADATLINHLCRLSDILKFTREEFQYLAGGDARSYMGALWQAGVQLVLITDGDRPVKYYTTDIESEITPPRVAVVDSTGAGDAFIGAFLYALSHIKVLNSVLGQRHSLEALLSFSVHCGAHTVTHPGAFTALPTFSDVAHHWQVP